EFSGFIATARALHNPSLLHARGVVMAKRSGGGGSSSLWPLLLIGGVLLVLAERAGLLQKLFAMMRGPTRGARGWGRRALSPHLEAFRNAILGVDKHTVAAALGPPPTTIGEGSPWIDDTWYYPLDRVQRMA